MSPAEAVRLVRRIGQARRFFLSRHALERMQGRGAREHDVRHALSNATSCAHDPPPPEKWKVTGPDLDGDDLVLVILLQGVGDGPDEPVCVVRTVF